MITLTRKEYEIEEKVQLKDDNDNVIYEFMMQLTPEETNEVKNLIFDENDIKLNQKLSKLDANSDEYIREYDKFIESAKERQEKLEKLAYKDHREEFRKKAGEYKYGEMTDLIFDFFVQTFAQKKLQQINTMSTNLRKISNN